MKSKYSLPLAVTIALVLVAGSAMAMGYHVDPTALAVGGAPAIMAIGNVVDPAEIKKLEEALTKKAGEVVEACGRALQDEMKKFRTITGDTNEKLSEACTKAKEAVDALSEVKTRLTDVEQKAAKGNTFTIPDEAKSPGEIFVNSDEFKSLAGGKGRGMKANIDPVLIGSIFHRKTAIINVAPPAASGAQPLVVADRVPGIIPGTMRRLTIRDLLPQMRTNSNLVEFASENVFTNNAAGQFSSPDSRENVLKGESAITFQLSNAPVTTIAHFVPASRQILADAQGLSDYINMRLMYGLKLYEEAQLLLGDGTAANLNGLWTGGTNYSQGVSNDTKLDALLKSILQVALSEYSADGIILNPVDWTAIQLLKDTQGRYLFTNPADVTTPRIWGLPVVATNSMSVGNFMTAAFGLAAAIWDREDATIRVSQDYSDFFARNMVAILAEERIAQTIYRATAIIRGALPASGT
jgi:HK97 family phage major capsid protein